jgi:2-succinyl-6-hydroxy-2,4-cyclohexadiene-1-carboxylate synthase
VPAQLNVTTSGNGPRLVLVHGFTQSCASWAPVLPSFGGFELVTPDLPGHGGSPLAEGGLVEAARLLGEGCGQGTYVGYSLGGRTCLHLALLRPELVDRLVLVSTSAGLDEAARDDRRQSDEALAARLEAGGDEGLGSFLDDWLSGPLFAHLSAEQADMPSRLVNRAAGLASSLRQCGAGAQLSLWDEVGWLPMPVLVVAGEHDARYVDIGARLAAAIGPNAEFVLAAGAGHSVPFEMPEAFASLVGSFALKSLSRQQTEPRTPGGDGPSSPEPE